MIDRKELMIGNMVIGAHERNAPIVKITEIRSLGAFAEHMPSMGSSYYLFEGLMPIELNPDWLDKFDFEKKLILGNADGYWYQRSGLSYNEKHLGWWFRGSFPNGPQYVHQLQNLYFALTREELTIKSFNQSN